ncbi:MAG: ABC transporter ATP-binding protein [Thermomicrobiales bacterium]
MEPIIVVDELSKRYKSAKINAVDAVSFSVASGEFFALLGPNGAGKTPTISVLTTMLLPTSGKVTIAGYDVVADAGAVRQNVGIIFQKPSLDLNLTAEENVRFHAVLYGLYPFRPTFSGMPREYRDRVKELAAVVGIENELFNKMKTFSGGMKRKLEIVRGLIHQPKVLFLDEPTTGLDPASRRSLWDYLTSVRTARGTTVFLTTHYLEEAETADTICVVNKGTVVALGTPDQLKSTLAREYVDIDADDRDALRQELARLAIASEGDGPFRIPVEPGQVHQMLRDIATPLTTIQTHAPTLEDAYLAIVTRTAEDEDQ